MMEELDIMKRILSQSVAGNNTHVHDANNEIQIHPQVSVGDYSIPYENSVHEADNIEEEDVLMQELMEAQEI